MTDTESLYGTVIYATSNGSIIQYPDNKPSQFINTLKSQIKLDPNLKYNVKLHNYHIPLYETCLVGGDYINSCLEYNIGFFIHDPNKQSYVLDQSSVKRLFTLAPEVNIDGIFDNEEYHLFKYNVNDPSNDIRNDIVGGKPSLRALKENFIHDLGMSLKLNEKQKDKTILNREMINLKVFKDMLAKRNDKLPPHNLFGRFFSDLNYFLLDEFSFLSQEDNMAFFMRLMLDVDYGALMYDHMKLSAQLPWNTAEEMNDNTNGIGDMTEVVTEHLETLDSQCSGLNKYHSYTNDELRTILRGDSKPATVQNIIKRACQSGNKKKIKKRKRNKTDNGDNTSRSVRSVEDTDGMSDLNKASADEEEEEGVSSSSSSVKVVDNQPFMGIFVTFGKRMARFFNIKPSQYVLLAHFGFPTVNHSDYYIKLTPNFRKSKIEKLMIYSNIVKPNIRVGDYLTNLLDTISVTNSNIIHRPYAVGSNKPLRNHVIDSVSIVCADDKGNMIHFENNTESTFELHIKPIEEK